MNNGIQQFDYSVDLLQSLTWRFNQATNLISLATQLQEFINTNQTAFWASWYTDVFDLRTADDFGLAVWAIILNIPLTESPGGDPRTTPTFGFGTDAGSFSSGYYNFNNGTFASDSPSGGLTDEEKRFILRLRYFQLTCRGAIPEINKFLGEFIPSITDTGTLYVVDNLDMTIEYVFTFTPDPRLLDILELYDILPRPAGVKATVTVM